MITLYNYTRFNKNNFIRTLRLRFRKNWRSMSRTGTFWEQIGMQSGTTISEMHFKGTLFF